MLPFDKNVFREYWPTALVAFFLLALASDFVLRFLFRAWSRLRSLKRILLALRKQDAFFARQKVRDLVSIVGEADEEPIFPELWSEYCKTLHAQRGVDEHGQQRILRWRATALAESFFTEQALVNSPLRTEYFKHLPGILTGLGIIGTFFGLIKGLSHFHVSPTPEQTQAALSNLIQAVGHAFYLSAAAIVLAILFTCIEKLLLSGCYARVERIQHAIDRVFQGGASEEYLDRLVQACETSATQALHIKEALVADLRQILQEVTAQQVAASSRESSRLAADMGGVIASTLGGPITDILATVQATVERASSGSWNPLNTALVDVLAQFSERMAESVEKISAVALHSQAQAEKLNGSGRAMEQIEAATHLLREAMHGTTEVLDDYRKTREVFAVMVQELNETLQNAKGQGLMTSDLIEKLAAAAAQLGNAERQSESYLLGVNEVLRKAHEAFAENVEKTLQRGNAQFHKELSEAVGLLSTGIRDLESVLERVPVEG